MASGTLAMLVGTALRACWRIDPCDHLKVGCPETEYLARRPAHRLDRFRERARTVNARGRPPKWPLSHGVA